MIFDDLERVVDEYNVSVTKMELDGCKASIIKTREGYQAVVDSRLNDEEARMALEHELVHVVLGHLDSKSHWPEYVKEEEVDGVVHMTMPWDLQKLLNGEWPVVPAFE